MKLDTIYWIRLKNSGSPDSTVTKQCDAREMSKLFVEFLIRETLNGRITVTIARSEADLEVKTASSRKQQDADDLMNMFDEMFNEAEVNNQPDSKES